MTRRTGPPHDEFEAPQVDAEAWADEVRRREQAAGLPTAPAIKRTTDRPAGQVVATHGPRGGPLQGMTSAIQPEVDGRTALLRLARSSKGRRADIAPDLFWRAITDREGGVIVRLGDKVHVATDWAGHRLDAPRAAIVAPDGAVLRIIDMMVDDYALREWIGRHVWSPPAQVAVVAPPVAVTKRQIPRVDHRGGDDIIGDKMRADIKSAAEEGRRLGATDAARAYLREAEGNGNDVTKLRRIVKRYFVRSKSLST